MRCKKHYTDLSGSVGVCASCLRDRLLSIIAAQEQAESKAQAQTLEETLRDLDTNPVVRRSVSPFNNRRKLNHSGAPAAAVVWPQNHRHKDHLHHPPAAPRHHHSLSDQLFFSTPQVGPATGDYIAGGCSNKKRSFIRFFSLNFFRSKNRNTADLVSDPRASVSNFREPCGGGNATSSTASPSCFSGVVNGGRHRRKQPVYADEPPLTAAAGAARRQHCRDRGMSPVRHSDEDELNEASSGYESTESWKQTPRRTPAHPHVRRSGAGGGAVGGPHARNLSGLAFCLSPLVRASPNRQWNQKVLPPDGVVSGEIRAPAKPHLSNTKSFCANRSRKLADFGRFNPNR